MNLAKVESHMNSGFICLVTRLLADTFYLDEETPHSD